MATKKTTTTTKMPETLRRQMLDHVDSSRDEGVASVNRLVNGKRDKFEATFLKQVDARSHARKIAAAEKKVTKATENRDDLMREAKSLGLNDDATGVTHYWSQPYHRQRDNNPWPPAYSEYRAECKVLEDAAQAASKSLWELHKADQWQCRTAILNAKTTEEAQAALKKFTLKLEKYPDYLS